MRASFDDSEDLQITKLDVQYTVVEVPEAIDERNFHTDIVFDETLVTMVPDVLLSYDTEPYINNLCEPKIFIEFDSSTYTYSG